MNLPTPELKLIRHLRTRLSRQIEMLEIYLAQTKPGTKLHRTLAGAIRQTEAALNEAELELRGLDANSGGEG